MIPVVLGDFDFLDDEIPPEGGRVMRKNMCNGNQVKFMFSSGIEECVLNNTFSFVLSKHCLIVSMKWTEMLI